MGNYLKMTDKRRILALLELGWAYRRIERETGVRRETIARYDPCRQPKAANLSTGSHVSADDGLSKAANVSAGSEAVPNGLSADGDVPKAANLSAGFAGAHGPPGLAAPYHAQIEAGMRQGLTAQRIWQDLCVEVAYPHSYGSVRRYVSASSAAIPSWSTLWSIHRAKRARSTSSKVRRRSMKRKVGGVDHGSSV